MSKVTKEQMNKFISSLYTGVMSCMSALQYVSLTDEEHAILMKLKNGEDVPLRTLAEFCFDREIVLGLNLVVKATSTVGGENAS